MKVWQTFIRSGFAVVTLAALSAPGWAADAVNGKALALQWCASCHLVSNDQTSASGASLPSFYDISRDLSFNEAALKTFLADPHPQMPNMSLTNLEIADLARYIDTLEN